MYSTCILGFKASIASYEAFLDEIVSFSKNKESSSYVCVANVHMFIEAYNDRSFNEIMNRADIVTPDGMPLVAALNLLYGIKQGRVAGMDLLPDLLKQANINNLSVFFYGGTDEMMKETSSFVTSKYPELRANYYSPPFRQLSFDEELSVVDTINSASPNMVFVVLGCPKQEKWMASMKGRINACMIGIGGALPVMIGLQKRAPLWMQKSSLEWLYRLIQDPKRLFKRYFVTNSMFIYLLLKEIIKIKVFRLKTNVVTY